MGYNSMARTKAARDIDPAEDLAILYLSKTRGYKAPEIAEITGRSERTIYASLARTVGPNRRTQAWCVLREWRISSSFGSVVDVLSLHFTKSEATKAITTDEERPQKGPPDAAGKPKYWLCKAPLADEDAA